MPRPRPATRLPPPAIYAAAILLGWWIDRRVSRWPLDWGSAGAAAGLLLVAAGAGLMVAAFLTMRRHRTTVNPFRGAAALCTGGPFRFSRNPIYVGDWLVLLGASLWLATAWPLAFAPLVWLAIRYGVIAHEERHLESVFGDEYRDYRQRVRRWL